MVAGNVLAVRVPHDIDCCDGAKAERQVHNRSLGVGEPVPVHDEGGECEDAGEDAEDRPAHDPGLNKVDLVLVEEGDVVVAGSAAVRDHLVGADQQLVLEL